MRDMAPAEWASWALLGDPFALPLSTLRELHTRIAQAVEVASKDAVDKLKRATAQDDK